MILLVTLKKDYPYSKGDELTRTFPSLSFLFFSAKMSVGCIEFFPYFFKKCKPESSLTLTVLNISFLFSTNHKQQEVQFQHKG